MRKIKLITMFSFTGNWFCRSNC